MPTEENLLHPNVTRDKGPGLARPAKKKREQLGVFPRRKGIRNDQRDPYTPISELRTSAASRSIDPSHNCTAGWLTLRNAIGFPVPCSEKTGVGLQ